MTSAAGSEVTPNPDANESIPDEGAEACAAENDSAEGTGKRGREEADEDAPKRSRIESLSEMSPYLKELLEEQIKLVPFASALPNCARLLQKEIDALKEGKGNLASPGPSQPSASANSFAKPQPPQDPPRAAGGGVMREVLSQVAAQSRGGEPLETSIINEQELPDGSCKTSLKIMVPTDRHPGFNFIGRLLGPRGNTLKELQANTGCKMLIRGKGSIKFKRGETEWDMARLPQHAHLNEPLHVIVDYEGPSRGRDAALSMAENMLKELCMPPSSEEADTIKRQQLKELKALNGGTLPPRAPDLPPHNRPPPTDHPRASAYRRGGGGGAHTAAAYAGYGTGYGTHAAQTAPSAQSAYQAGVAAAQADQLSMAAYQQGFAAAQQALAPQIGGYGGEGGRGQDPYTQIGGYGGEGGRGQDPYSMYYGHGQQPYGY